MAKLDKITIWADCPLCDWQSHFKRFPITIPVSVEVIWGRPEIKVHASPEKAKEAVEHHMRTLHPNELDTLRIDMQKELTVTG